MKGRPVDQLVYEYLFPRPRATDPQNFHTILSRHLIYEVRQEVHSFYGHLDTQEAKYPGLDYCNAIHRIRLSRWQWHRRLFRAFDGLRLTPAEIAGLTKWEGTKWAKERYEKEQGIVIHDTSTDDVPHWSDLDARLRARAPQWQLQEEPEPEPKPDPEAAEEVAAAAAAAADDANMSGDDNDEDDDDDNDDADDADDADDDDDSDVELRSIGVALNERLRERVAAHNAGDTSQPLDEDWEQWLKNAIETGEFPLVAGEFPLVADQIARLAGQPTPSPPANIFSSRIVDAAREGNWHEIPDFMHDMLRQNLELERRQGDQQQQQQQQIPRASAAATASSGAVASMWTRRTYSDLRLPVAGGAGGAGGTGAASEIRVQPTAQAPGA